MSEILETGNNPSALVAWSGGRDSTLLLVNLLEKTNKPVRAISIETDQIVASNIQRVYMENLKKTLSEKYRNFQWDIITLESKSGISAPCFGQCLTWLTLLSLHVYTHEDLYLGYVRGDDVWHVRSEIFQMFNLIMTTSEKQSKLILPLEWYSKTDIFKSMQAYELLDKTWFCQESGPLPCGTCASCLNDKLYKPTLEWPDSYPRSTAKNFVSNADSPVQES